MRSLSSRVSLQIYMADAAQMNASSLTYERTIPQGRGRERDKVCVRAREKEKERACERGKEIEEEEGG